MGDIYRFDHDGVIATSQKAVLLNVNGDEIWIPRSVLVDPEDGDGMERGDPADQVAVLAWFAEDRGLTI
uniref:Uncharacterized protein n=1 Tax=viral metagenome TaxID=1070528 RepID=A0A6M3M5S0_9ZZZZ